MTALLLLTSPPRTLSVVGGGSAAGPSHSRTSLGRQRGPLLTRSAKQAWAGSGRTAGPFTSPETLRLHWPGLGSRWSQHCLARKHIGSHLSRLRSVPPLKVPELKWQERHNNSNSWQAAPRSANISPNNATPRMPNSRAQRSKERHLSNYQI
jgi:hypothetical protein